ncbi:MAG: carboxypeptidase regulatory-like domain-containing protein [Armatimonadetes bacterium]|nr:carboxypeptidase regulatory-like domain-containing protein [Armatimonadota bacterium]MDW8121813.1 carboxypeptidase regulatory-like domain-containing protein [Armatimonadota bacterium]
MKFVSRLASLFAVAFATSTLWAQGTIKGKVVFQGTPLKPRMISMKQDKKCDALHKGKPVTGDDFVLNPNGTLQWVLVYVKSGAKGGKAPSKPVVLTQHECIYRPHVFGIMVGQPLEIRNDDPLLHNVHFVSKKNGTFNLGQPVKGMKTQKVFRSPELPPSSYFKCDVHPWMRAYVGIFDHPYFAVTDSKGTFTISGLPAGTYEIEAWHEKLGTQSQKVTLKAGETKDITFVFKR